MDKINKVLIVDDEPVGRQLLEAILYRENFDLHFAEDGNMAYEKALQLKPDLILMDVMMPGMDGFEVCRRLREHEILVNVPIMLITALDDRDSMIKGLDAGADDYIAKPFDRIEVLAKIKNITQFDRYKRIVHDKGNKEVKEKTPVNKELSLYYTSLIQKSLLPSNEYISKLLPQYFIIVRSQDTVSSNIFWITEKKNKIIIVLCNRKQQGITDILMNILGVTNLNKIIYKKDVLDPQEIINDLKAELQKNDLNPESSISSDDNMDIALCILDRESLKLQYSGLNIPLYYVKDNESGNTTAAEINLSKKDSFYILSTNLLKYIETGSGIPGYRNLSELLQEQHNLEMAGQESFFSELIDKEISAGSDLKDIVFFGVRI